MESVKSYAEITFFSQILMKHFGLTIMYNFTHVVNASLNPSDVMNYRPVSLLPFFSKSLAKVVFKQASDILSQKSLLDPEQSGLKSPKVSL